MNCKNCGAKLKNGAKVCPNCGALIDENEGYILLTSDDIMDDVYTGESPKKKGKTFIRVLSALITLAIIGAGAYYFFANYYNKTPDKPNLTFETGSGIINDDEKVIYVTLRENARIEYIHGVSLYNYDKTAKNAEKKEAVSTDYEYTKSIDSTFRAIFFNTSDFEISDGENIFTFEMNFSFYDSDEIYTYTQPIRFSGNITEDASDIIFDHSLDDNAKPNVENGEQTTSNTTEAPESGYDFIYNSYWYTEPYSDEGEYTIYSIKFNKDNTYTSTQYHKKENENWQVSTFDSTFEIEDGYAVLNNGEATESTFYKIDFSAKKLSEEKDGQIISVLTARKYNSIKNAEDFFGI